MKESPPTTKECIDRGYWFALAPTPKRFNYTISVCDPMAVWEWANKVREAEASEGATLNNRNHVMLWYMYLKCGVTEHEIADAVTQSQSSTIVEGAADALLEIKHEQQALLDAPPEAAPGEADMELGIALPETNEQAQNDAGSPSH